MFIEPSWQESLISLLIAINGSLGVPERAAALRPLASSDVLEVAQEISRRSYKPDRWFGIGGVALANRQPIPAFQPAIQPGSSYGAVVIDVEPSGREMVSSRSGGLLYDDPFYAVLAAYNIGRAPKRENLSVGLSVEVKTSSRDQAWGRRQAIVDAIASGTYKEDRYFSISGPVHVSRHEKLWRTGTVSGIELTKLVDNGRAAAAFSGTTPQVYGIYNYVVPTP